jgi:hypothetical protein
LFHSSNVRIESVSLPPLQAVCLQSTLSRSFLHHNSTNLATSVHQLLGVTLVVAVAVAVYSSSVLSFKPTNSAEGYSSSFVLFFNSLSFCTVHTFPAFDISFVYKSRSRSIAQQYLNYGYILLHERPPTGLIYHSIYQHGKSSAPTNL